jgi:outer membrane receptor protein involved in Fe transport
LSGETLKQMNVANTVGVLKLLPSVSYTTFGPGFGQIYMRGVVSGGDGNHTGPLPSVGVYLDEEPITTIQGPLDLHMYDIQRVEALAGPQGTLYGASSQSGTIRYITNKPDPSGFSASVSAEVNTVDHGGTGYVTEGYVNIPFSSSIALRASGWSKQEAGFIDNVVAERTYPTSGITVSTAPYARKDFNFADTRGGRAALKIDLNDSWSITPSISGQGQHTIGSWAYDPKNYGDLKLAHFTPDNSEDRWTQSALTVQGKIGNFDIVYAFAHLNRDDRVDSDYSDYSYWYDVDLGYGAYIVDNNGNYIDPTQFIHGGDNYLKTSNELRVSSPKDDRFRYTIGLFSEQQQHKIHQEYRINNLADDLSITGLPGILWLTEQTRNDNDSAIFGEMTFDFTDRWSATVGGRYFHTEDSLYGFYGFAPGYSTSQGEAKCFLQQPFRDAPCVEVDKTTKESDSLGKASLTYKIDSDKMIYATWSEGFRPGGINRRSSLPPYKSDFLTNYEFGWKTEWFDHRLRWNGAAFQENWKDFQFALLGANGLTEIKNAAQARIRGLESNIAWAATYNLTLAAGIALYDGKLSANYCGFTEPDGSPVTNCPAGSLNPDGDVIDGPQAPKGTRLPITAKEKGNFTARYNFDAWGQEAYFQGSLFFEGRRTSDLRLATNDLLGDLPGYGTVDLSAGFKHDLWSFSVYLNNAFDNRGQLYRFAQCAEDHCFRQVYVVPTQPRTLGLRVTRDF